MIELKNPMHEVHYKGGEISKPATVVSANDFPWMIRNCKEKRSDIIRVATEVRVKPFSSIYSLKFS